MTIECWIAKKTFNPILARSLRGNVSILPRNPFDKQGHFAKQCSNNNARNARYINFTASLSSVSLRKEVKSHGDYQEAYRASRFVASAAAAAAAVIISGMYSSTSDKTSCCGIVGVVGTGNYDAR